MEKRNLKFHCILEQMQGTNLNGSEIFREHNDLPYLLDGNLQDRFQVITKEKDTSSRAKWTYDLCKKKLKNVHNLKRLMANSPESKKHARKYWGKNSCSNWETETEYDCLTWKYRRRLRWKNSAVSDEVIIGGCVE